SRYRDRRQVADRAAAGERATGRGIADETGHPPNGLVLHHGGGAGVDGQVDVVRLRQQVPDRSDLEPRGSDEGEVPWPGLGDRLVQVPGGIVERLMDGHRLFGEGAADQLADPVVERRLLGTEPIERPPRLRDQLRRVLQRLLARGVEAQGSLWLAPRPRSSVHRFTSPTGDRRRGPPAPASATGRPRRSGDRKSTRLNSSHVSISYAVFCLKKKISAVSGDRSRLQ